MNGTPDYDLQCDGCGARFDCGDDSFYSWPVLCAAAEGEGWRLGAGAAGHLCAACRASRAEPSVVAVLRDPGRHPE